MSGMVSLTDWYILETAKRKLETGEPLTVREGMFVAWLRDQCDRIDLESLDSNGFPEEWA